MTDWVGRSKKAYERDFDVIGNMDSSEGPITFRLTNTQYIDKDTDIAVATGKSVIQGDGFDKSERLAELITVSLFTRPAKNNEFYQSVVLLNPLKKIYKVAGISSRPSHRDSVDPMVAYKLIQSIMDTGLYLIINPTEVDKKLQSKFSKAYSLILDHSMDKLKLPPEEKGASDDEQKNDSSEAELDRIKKLGGVDK